MLRSLPRRMALSTTSKAISSSSFSPSSSAAAALFSTTSGGSSSSARRGTGGSMDEPDAARINNVYVHHVTKIVLQHLQEAQSAWLVRHGLDRGLRLQPNGTAVLQFPPKNNSTNESNGFLESGRIWTTYDAASQQHWLCLYKGKLVGRFLLKDTSMQQRPPPSFAQLLRHQAAADDKIRAVVNALVQKVG